MRYVDEYRAPEQVLQLIDRLKTRASLLDYTKEKPLRIMEVCGGHTHAIFKFGLDQLLPENIEFIHDVLDVSVPTGCGPFLINRARYT